MSYRIKECDAEATGIRRIVREQLEHALREGAALDGPDEAKAIHAVLRLIKKEVDSGVFREENDRLREVAHTLAGARDADVRVQTLAKLRNSAGLETEAFAGLESLLLKQKDAVDVRPQQHEAALALLLSIHDRLPGWPLDEVTIEALCCAFAKTYRKARKCFSPCSRSPQCQHLSFLAQTHQTRLVSGSHPSAAAERCDLRNLRRC